MIIAAVSLSMCGVGVLGGLGYAGNPALWFVILCVYMSGVLTGLGQA